MVCLAPLSVLKSGSRNDIASRIARVEEALARSNLSQTSTQDASETSPVSTPASSASAPSASAISTSASTTKRNEESEPLYNAEESRLLSSPHTGVTNGALLGQIHFMGCHLGEISTQNGIPLFSEDGQQWIASRTGQQCCFEKFTLINAAQAKKSFASSPLPTLSHCIKPEDLPERAMLHGFVETFRHSGASLIFPVIDVALFRRTIHLAYEPPEGANPFELASAKACVLAFSAIICLFLAEENKVPPIDCDACALMAQLMLSDIIQDARLTSLQTLFMLSMYETFSGRNQPANMFHSMACRMVLQLGGQNHSKPEPHENPQDLHVRAKRHLRMLFWLCYVFDKDITLRTVGQPPSLPDEYCDLTLPEKYLENCYNPSSYPKDRGLSPREGELVPTLPGDLRLSMIKSRTCKLLYSTEAMRKSEADLLRDIRELDDELECWRLSVPLDFRPALSVHNQHKIKDESNLHLNMMHIFLRLDYHYLMSAIHRASGRCRVPEGEAPGTNMTSALLSSIELSVEASRSTITYLHSAAHQLAAGAFW
ncbi:transcriptional activator Mut3p [Paramyrothecium foliicola]|nr:transcriptional activator Mut3p [Paramyrothecium foliicola]